MFRKQYNPVYDASVYATAVVGDSVTKQSFKDECDVNRIVARAQKTGFMPSGERQPQYGDFSNVPDYRESLDIVMKADASFAALPAEVRKYFDNDPAAYMDFLSDEKNRDEAIKLGLVNPKPTAETASKAPETASAPVSDTAA